MKKMSNSWFEPDATGKVNVDLKEVIRYAQAHYGRHTDWYLRHRDGGIKCLVVLLTAELAIAGTAAGATAGSIHADGAVGAVAGGFVFRAAG